MIPEEWLDSAGKRLSAGPRFFGHPFILAHFGHDPSTGVRSRRRGLNIYKNITKVRLLAQEIADDFHRGGSGSIRP
jgi:hypothetical protein